MFYEFVDQVNDLRKHKKSYAIAIVTGHAPPISGKRGDKAIIFEDGRILGWIGGGCTQSVVKQEAKKALKDGKSRVVRITPNKSSEPAFGVIEYNMTCHSGGDIEVYIEPILPQPQLIIVGKSLVAQTLAKLGKIINYDIISISAQVDEELFPSADYHFDLFKVKLDQLPISQYRFLIISTQGEHDEEALEKFVKLESSYMAFVASRKKANEVFKYLELAGIDQSDIDKIKVPAGIDINAKTPKEVAVSILAEIIFILRKGLEPLKENEFTTQAESLAEEKNQGESSEICPTCGMIANPSTSPSSEYEGKTYYFCCKGCEAVFLDQPERYLTPEVKNE